MEKHEDSVNQYLEALEDGSYEDIIRLFDSNATVQSPLYGKMPASDFYKDLLKDTEESKITLLNIFLNEDLTAAAVHFEYKWKLVNGENAPFEVVDIIKFSKDGLISELKIIYDSAATKSSFDKLKSSNL